MYSLFLVILGLGAAEWMCRKLGWQCSCQLNSNELTHFPFKLQDTLKTIALFTVDSNGIQYPNCNTTDSFQTIFHGYSKYFRNIKVNEHGFRTASFDSSQENILLLGDSYTWGFSAKPISASFADLLSESLSKKYKVYNAGLPGVDVATYLALTKKLLPVIKPKILIVNFFLGNDIVNYNKQLHPYQSSDLFATTSGAFMAYNYNSSSKDSEEVFDSAQNAFEYYRHLMVLNSNDSLVLFLASHSALFTALHRKIFGLNRQTQFIHKYPADRLFTSRALRQIQTLCQQHHCKFILSIIPDLNNTTTGKEEDDLMTLGVHYHYPSNLTKTDYTPMPDNHFNNCGQYAEFLKTIISEEN
ncbi:MAG: SGNH/GDSL hydrolase family protein [Chitinophagales bacterium]